MFEFTRRKCISSLAAMAALILLPVQAHAQDALPSWNDVAAKSAIVDFVTAVTTEGGPHYVAPADRVATFENGDDEGWTPQLDTCSCSIVSALPRPKVS